LKISFANELNHSSKKDYDPVIFKALPFGYRSLYNRKPRLSLWLCDDKQSSVLHDGVSSNLSRESYSNCGPVIEYNFIVAIVGSF